MGRRKSVKGDELLLPISSLDMERDTVRKIGEIGIFTINDLNNYSIEEFKARWIEDSIVFNDILPLYIKYKLPKDLNRFPLKQASKESLASIGITSSDDLFAREFRTKIYDQLNLNIEVIQDINKVFSFYDVNPLSSQDSSMHNEPAVAQQDGSFYSDVNEENDSIVSRELVKERIKALHPDMNKLFGSKKYSHFKIRLASPNEIRYWSYGEVKNHETIQVRSNIPKDEGLFCEKIFGPVRDYTCKCTTQSPYFRGHICPKCGIEWTESSVRRERMGRIELASPCVHPWFMSRPSSILAKLLGIKQKLLDSIIECSVYVVTKSSEKNSELRAKRTLNEANWEDLSYKYDDFTAETGGKAIQFLLKDLDLDKEIYKIKSKLDQLGDVGKLEKLRLIQRLDILQAFKDSDNKPEWLVLEVLPVLPPDLRPMVALDGGKYATVDINDLYRNVINRNRRILNVDSITPRMIIRNEKRMLQQAVNNLIDSGKNTKKPTGGKSAAPVKSLTHQLTGKKGRFRLNLLGKRVDYSGRSVIIVGPELEMHQCGIPREMAYILFKPFILRQIKIYIDNAATPSLEKGTQMERKHANINAIYEQKSEICLSILERVVKEHPVLLNRAPTLHRLGIQAFEPILIDGKAIRLNPLVCAGFNADFDGDQMGVHLVLTPQAQAEARILMLASNNILNPRDGKPIVSTTQDIVLGNYYLTTEKNVDSEKETFLEGSFYNDFNEVILALENGLIDLHTRIFVDPKQIKSTFTDSQKTKKLITTPGKLIFNDILPESFPYLAEPSETNLEVKTPDKFFFSAIENPRSFIMNLPISKPFDKRFIELIISKLFSTLKISETSKTLDALKSLGFKYSTLSGISIALSDFILNPGKKKAIAEARIKVDEVGYAYNLGLLTKDFKRKTIETIWGNVVNEMKDEINRYLPKDNNLFIMKDSGARGDDKQLVQLESMIGLISGHKGKTIEFPVLSSYMEGLSVDEYFICTHGARRNLENISLKTSSSGYFTRRLVDAVHDVVIREDDCQTDKYIEMEALAREETERKDDNNVEISYLITLEERILGRYAAKAVINPTTKEVIVNRNEMITEKIAKEVVKAGVTKVAVRSVLKCNSEHGVCAKCYGFSLSSNSPADIGEAVGVIAAQSIGEPGTQLTMRTIHSGGVAGGYDITTGLSRVQELLDCRSSLKNKALLSPADGIISGINYSKGIITVEQKNTGKKYECVYDLKVKPTKERGNIVKIRDRLTPRPIDPRELMKYKSVDEAQRYIIGEALKVYYSASAKINDKHLEIILKQMFNWVYIIDGGDTSLLPNSEVSRLKFLKVCKECALEGKEFPSARVIIMGITKVASNSDSFLSAASFQNTRKQLANAAIRGSKDELHGLKENAMIGGIIPAGTGLIDEKFEFSSESTVD